LLTMQEIATAPAAPSLSLTPARSPCKPIGLDSLLAVSLTMVERANNQGELFEAAT